jgi:hypothetical protein
MTKKTKKLSVNHSLPAPSIFPEASNEIESLFSSIPKSLLDSKTALSHRSKSKEKTLSFSSHTTTGSLSKRIRKPNSHPDWLDTTLFFSRNPASRTIHNRLR